MKMFIEEHIVIYKLHVTCIKTMVLQGDSERKVNILRANTIGHCENKVHTNRCPIMNFYRDRTVWISRTNPISFLFVGLEEDRNLQTKGECKRRIAWSHFECCCTHK